MYTSTQRCICMYSGPLFQRCTCVSHTDSAYRLALLLLYSYKGNFPRQGSQQRSSAGNQATKSKPSAGSSTVCLSSARIGVAPSTEQSSHCEQTPAFDGEPPAKRQCHEGADPESRPVNDSSLPTSGTLVFHGPFLSSLCLSLKHKLLCSLFTSGMQ